MEKLLKLLNIFPDSLKLGIEKAGYEILERTEEIRVRRNCPLILETADREFFISDRGLTLTPSGAKKPDKTEIEELTAKITENSLYAYMEDLKRGFITVNGGHRIGIAGTAVTEKGIIKNITGISSLNIRVAREIKGISDKLIPYIYDGRVKNTLIVSPPGAGKTTYLRDIIRNLSAVKKNTSIAVIDERCEIAAVYKGEMQNDLGIRCDVLSGFNKPEGIIHAVRALAPAAVATDEIGSDRDLEALSYAALSGVSVIATAHASDLLGLKAKGLTEYFEVIIMLKKNEKDRVSEIICL